MESGLKRTQCDDTLAFKLSVVEQIKKAISATNRPDDVLHQACLLVVPGGHSAYHPPPPPVSPASQPAQARPQKIGRGGREQVWVADVTHLRTDQGASTSVW